MPSPRNQPIDIQYLTNRSWWKNVARSAPDECWPWLKSTGSHGYGQTYDGITVRLAHRVAWVLAHSEQIPADMTIDHLCRNRICCNPQHLRVMTNVVNATDNGQGRKTHCPRGHTYDLDNTYIDPRGHRRCRRCAQLRRF